MSTDKYKRKPPSLPIRDKVLIMCGGETEEIYFDHYKNKHKRDLRKNGRKSDMNAILFIQEISRPIGVPAQQYML